MFVLICIVALVKDAHYNIPLVIERVYNGLAVNWSDCVKLLIPALCYVVQNNIKYVAISRLAKALMMFWIFLPPVALCLREHRPSRQPFHEPEFNL